MKLLPIAGARILATTCLLLLCVASAHGADKNPSAKLWKKMARTDLGAAYELLSENHPAAVPALGDEDFRRRLESGYKTALSYAAKADTYPSYRAALLYFANAFSDRHIWSRDLYTPRRLDWPGFLAVRRGGWRVFARDEVDAEAPQLGAEIASCDGQALDELAKASYGTFNIDWSIEAQRIKRSPWLFVDDGNPFVPHPEKCVFRKDGADAERTLSWRRIERSALLEHLNSAKTYGHAGMGVRSFDGGYWIALEELDDTAQAVIDATANAVEQIRAARIVVVDLRGNGGGNSAWGTNLARVLFGADYVEAADPESPGQEGLDYWRVSPGNLATIESYIARFSAQLGDDSDVVKLLKKQRDQVAEALAKRETLAPRFSGRRTPAVAAPARELQSPLRGRLVLLTDAACFSSCLLVTDLLRKLGALHVGHATDANTNYMEVREIVLPSGLSTFSTLQRVNFSVPFRVGPFEPSMPFDGDITDTAPLEEWINSDRFEARWPQCSHST